MSPSRQPNGTVRETPHAAPDDDDDNDGPWTYVKSKSARGKNRHPTHLPQHPVSRREPLAPSLTRQQIEAQYRQIQSQWRSQPSFDRLMTILQSNAATHTPVTQAICFGNGSFDPHDGVYDKIRRAHLQTNAFLAIVDTLSKLQASPIPCFFQEPAYTKQDESFLGSLGHTVVHNPAGFDMVNETTLVFGVHLYKEVYGDILAHSYPAVFVGTSWATWEQALSSASPPLGRLREMDLSYDRFDFPREKGDHTFSSTCIYWSRNNAQASSEQPEPPGFDADQPEATINQKAST